MQRYTKLSVTNESPYVIRVLDIISKHDEGVKKSYVTAVCKGNKLQIIAAIDDVIERGFVSVKQVSAFDGVTLKVGRPSTIVKLTARGRQKYRTLARQFDVIESEKERGPVMALDERYTEDDLLKTMSEMPTEDEAYAYAKYGLEIGCVLAAKYDELALVPVDEFLRDTASALWLDKEKHTIMRTLWAAQQADNPHFFINLSNGDGAWYISASDTLLEHLRIKYNDRWTYKREVRDTYKAYRW